VELMNMSGLTSGSVGQRCSRTAAPTTQRSLCSTLVAAQPAALYLRWHLTLRGIAVLDAEIVPKQSAPERCGAAAQRERCAARSPLSVFRTRGLLPQRWRIISLMRRLASHWETPGDAVFP
jgi:hypothetical protein